MAGLLGALPCRTLTLCRSTYWQMITVYVICVFLASRWITHFLEDAFCHFRCQKRRKGAHIFICDAWRGLVAAGFAS
jgi:hypothetical protein